MISSVRISALLVLFVVVATLAPSADAFATKSLTSTRTVPTALNAFGKKKQPEEDLSYIETRDMTREEMLALNKENEEIMNMELTAMTGFSLVLSLPILYLCWVAFFSD